MYLGDSSDELRPQRTMDEWGVDVPRYQEAADRSGGRTLCERIMTPGFVLFIFTALNFITYYDRGAIAGCLSIIGERGGISSESEGLTDTQEGLIFSSFMIGYMVSCPLFVALGRVMASKWVIFVGMVLWSLACVGTGISSSYISLLICRIFVGVGEAAFVGFSVAIVERIAPQKSRILWIGTFYSMIPVGTAVGMAVGGVVGSLGPIGATEGWRLVFFSEVIVAAPIVLSVAWFPSKYNVSQGRGEGEYIGVLKALWRLLKNLKYDLLVFGYAMYCFVVGAVAVWAIPFLVRGPLQLSTTVASLIMGGVTALTGVCGSVVGGAFMDYLGGSYGRLGVMKIQIFITAMVALCVPLGIVALYMTQIGFFILLLILSVFALFAVTAPVNAAILSVVPDALKAYAVSYSVFFMHLLGDLPSPVITGFLSEAFSRGCTKLDEKSCIADTVNECHWVNGTKGPSSAQCVNRTQLRNALMIVFIILFFAVPAWMIVYWLLKCQDDEPSQSSLDTAREALPHNEESCRRRKSHDSQE